MIAITNDQGLDLDLQPDTKLVTEQAVAWLSDDELPGEFSYPIDVPLTDNNKRFVQHGYRPDLAQPRTELAVTVRMDGVLYRRCIFSFRVNSGKLSGYLKIDASEFYDKIRKLSLLEALPDVVFLGDGLLRVDLPTRLKQIAALEPGNFPCTFFPIRNQAFLEESFDEAKLTGYVRNDYVNAWELLPSGGYGFPVDLPNAPKFGRLICPQFYLSYVLERIMHLAGYRIESDWLAQKEIQRIVIVNQTAMSQHVTDLGDLIDGHKLVPGMFLPDMSVADFLKAVKGRFGLVFTYNSNSKICQIAQFSQTVANGPTVDLTEYQSGDYSTNDRDGKGYSVSEFIDSADELYRDSTGQAIKPTPQVTGKGQTAVTLSAGTTQLSYEVSGMDPNAQWFVPTVRQAGNVLDPAYKKSDRYLSSEGKRPNSIGLRLLFYRGMTTDSKNHPYPLGTPDVRDGKQVVVGTQALTLTGRNGSWKNFLRSYFYFRDQTQKITQPLLLPVSVLAGLELHRSVFLSLEDHIRRSYLYAQLQGEQPGQDGKAIVRLDALSLPSGIELGASLEAPRVWIELIQVKSYHTDGIITADTLTLTIKCWVDSSRTTPAIVTNLPVILRAKKSWRGTDIVAVAPEKTYEELQLSYLANGAVSIIDNAFIFHYSELPGVNYSVYWDRTVALDPGDEYNIIPA